MLKRLELIGFKSFADKTTFNFGDGVTAIVGPNGSGKSNIVDAVRWILGEQSAKSLRGGEMADVIFNGSSSRHGFGMAEVTMTFDNRKRQLQLDSEEVEITRRVHRDGQGEYLINGQVGRLKDIKDLFLGSGAGHDAYCIIEQGKVDVLLQASTKDRRTIFEEAAGISRFKAKKVETLRKLERVDQNLARVRDIIDEVNKQLRSVKLQAAKAQRYQEYSTRLKDLRVSLGLREYGLIQGNLTRETAQLEALKGDLDQRAARAAACEAEAERLEMLLADLEDAHRDHEATLAAAREEIKTQETTLSHEATLTVDLETELARARRRFTELIGRVAGLAEAAQLSEASLTSANDLASRQRTIVENLEIELRATLARLSELQAQVAFDQVEHLEQMRRAARLENEAVGAKAQVDNLSRERDRLRARTEQATEHLASLDLELRELTAADDQLHGRLTQARKQLAEDRGLREQLRQERDAQAEEAAQMRQHRSALSGRVDLLEGLINSREGLGAGIREVFSLLEQSEPGPWSNVLGLVADFLTVKREYAALIDLALGEWAQRFLVRDLDSFVEVLRRRTAPLSGRASFLPLQGLSVGENAELGQLRRDRLVEVSLLSRIKQNPGELPTPDHPGLVAPAEQLVSCDHPELTDLPHQLLGRTLLVKDLTAARAIAAHTPGFRLVTLQGELLEPDGTLTVGVHQAETGLLARKSELADLREQQQALETRLGQADRALSQARSAIEALDCQLLTRQEEIEVLAEQAAEMRARVDRHRDRRQGLHEEMTLGRDEMGRLDQDIVRLETTWQDARRQAGCAEEEVHRLHGRLHEADLEIRLRDGERGQRQEAFTQEKVSLGKMEERVAALRQQHEQRTRDLQQRRQELSLNDQAVRDNRGRIADSQQTMLLASSRLAHAYLAKESSQRAMADLDAEREQKRLDRVRLVQQAQSARGEWRTQQEQVHARELQANNLRHQRDTLLDRIKEDYQIDLAERFQANTAIEETPATAIPLDHAAAAEEIADLRKKLARLGSVNLEALHELNELEKRAADLQAQYTDLTEAKKGLEEIIGKINVDSRRLFLEVFATIRTHFQELFRKLFGGGMADVVLENEADVLESGIEIIARPPGKELRSISLMSGGEKTLTAVALLLAIFRSKPSPFCLLDEVDAALDEANIGRFTAVLREFLTYSQFIIVTHSKKTMACADVLYGITMQESGISKQVAVRFEDWVEEETKAAQDSPAA